MAQIMTIDDDTVSRIMMGRLLKDAGLVGDRPEGTRRLYRLQDDGIAAVQRFMAEVWGDAAARFTLLADNLADPQQGPA